MSLLPPLMRLLLSMMLLIILRAPETVAGGIGPCNEAGGYCIDKSLCSSNKVIQIKNKSLRRECGEAVCCQRQEAPVILGRGSRNRLRFDDLDICDTNPLCEYLGGDCEKRNSCKTKEAFGICGSNECTCCLEGSHQCVRTTEYSHLDGQCVEHVEDCVKGQPIQHGCMCNKVLSNRRIPLFGYFCAQKAGHGSTWDYNGRSGPNTWAFRYAMCKLGHQSPIDFTSNSTLHWATRSPLRFTGYNIKPTHIELINDGHTVSVFWHTKHQLQIRGGLLPDRYTLAKFHFHWGSDSSRGSEHTINGRSYPLEMHLVHYKESYGSVGEAVKYEDGLAVLGVMFKVTPFHNTALDPIINMLKRLRQPYSEIENTCNVALWNLLPLNLRTFFRYSGSLTTPTCNEAVIWTVFTDSVDISEHQLSEFRNLFDSHGERLQNNNRPTQPLNDRKVYLVRVRN